LLGEFVAKFGAEFGAEVLLPFRAELVGELFLLPALPGEFVAEFVTELAGEFAGEVPLLSHEDFVGDFEFAGDLGEVGESAVWCVDIVGGSGCCVVWCCVVWGVFPMTAVSLAGKDVVLGWDRIVSLFARTSGTPCPSLPPNPQ